MTPPKKKRGKSGKAAHPVTLLPKQAFSMATIGCSDAEIYLAYDMTEAEWRYGLDKYPGVAARLERARATGTTSIVKGYFDLAKGVTEIRHTKKGKEYIYTRPPDRQACEWWLRNRAKEHWQSNHNLEVNHSGKIEGNQPAPAVALDDMDDAAMLAQVAALHAALLAKHENEKETKH